MWAEQATIFGADWTHTFTQHLFNQVRYNYSSSSIEFGGGGFPECTDANILTGCPVRVSFVDGIDLNLETRMQRGHKEEW